MEEPSVLDYLKEKLRFWRKSSVIFPFGEQGQKRPHAESPEDQKKKSFWIGILALLPPIFTFTAQYFGEPDNRSVSLLVFFYVVALGGLLLLILFRDWEIQPIQSEEGEAKDLHIHWVQFLMGIFFAVLAFIFFYGNQFSIINVSLWIVSLMLIWSSINKPAPITRGWHFVQSFWDFVWERVKQYTLLKLLFTLLLFLLGLFSYPKGEEIFGITVLVLVVWSIRFPENWWTDLKSRWYQFREDGLYITPWQILFGFVFIVVGIYRFYALDQVPPEMFSDHAEKLIDVTDVLNGNYYIFFPRNTGREAFQMYLTAATAKIFGTGISFMSLKLGTSLMGMFTLPFIYLLGKEVRSKEVGLLAMFFAGVAYWLNVITRVALRFTLYPAFVAPTLYFLVRGIKSKRWNNFLYAGIALGIGLHGYSTFRVVPLVVLLTIVIYILSTSAKKNRQQAIIALVLVGLISLIVFLPLFRFAITNYDIFSYRMLSRLTDIEFPIPGSLDEIFFSNLWKAMTMFQWDNGRIWVHSIPGRPALDVFSAALFSMGAFLILVRILVNWKRIDLIILLTMIPLLIMPMSLITGAVFIIGCLVLLLRIWRERNWIDLVLLLLAIALIILPFNFYAAGIFIIGLLLLMIRNQEKWHWLDLALLTWIPLLLLPSVLSITFPSENPALNRSGGVIVPVVILIGIAIENLYINIRSRFPEIWGKFFSYGAVFIILVGTAINNAKLVFNDYYQIYRDSVWNTTEIGHVIKQFSETFGDSDHAWVIPYMHWVDTRLVGIHATGHVEDFAIQQGDIQLTVNVPPPKLYIYNQEDHETFDILRELYPGGTYSTYHSEFQGRDFIVYYVLK